MLFRTTIASSYDCDSALRDSIQYEAARLVTGASKGTTSATLHVYKALALESFSSRRKLLVFSVTPFKIDQNKQ